MRRGKRIRLEKAVQRAEAVLDQTVQKVERSKKRGRTSKDRSVGYFPHSYRLMLTGLGRLGRRQWEAKYEAAGKIQGVRDSRR